MFSAVKFIAAGVIVALFGGFLLAGVLTTQQGDEVAPGGGHGLTGDGGHERTDRDTDDFGPDRHPSGCRPDRR